MVPSYTPCWRCAHQTDAFTGKPAGVPGHPLLQTEYHHLVLRIFGFRALWHFQMARQLAPVGKLGFSSGVTLVSLHVCHACVRHKRENFISNPPAPFSGLGLKSGPKWAWEPRGYRQGCPGDATGSLGSSA